MAPEDPIIRFQERYADRLEREYPGEEYSWFTQMLREGCNQGTRHSYPKDYILCVINHEGDQATVNEYNVSKGSALNTSFTGSLTKQLSETATRFVVLSHASLYNLNFSYIDVIASVLKLDPSFLFLHFNRAREGQGLSRWAQAPAPLPSIHNHCISHFHIIAPGQ